MRHAEKKGRSCVSRIEQVTVLPAFFGHPLSIVLSDHTKFLVIIELVSFNLKRRSHLLFQSEFSENFRGIPGPFLGTTCPYSYLPNNRVGPI